MMVGEGEPPTLKNNGRKKRDIITQKLIRSNQRKGVFRSQPVGEQ